MATENQDGKSGVNQGCKTLPEEDQLDGGSISEILNRLMEVLKNDEGDKTISEATDKLKKDYEEMEKERKGITELQLKYREAHKEWKCKNFEMAKCQLEDIKEWAKKLDGEKKKAIDAIWNNYQEPQTKKECDWVKAKDAFDSLKSCKDLAESREGMANDDYKQIKDLQNIIKKQFDDMTALHKEGKGYYDTSQFVSVYALQRVFEEVLNNLAYFTTWEERKARCLTTGSCSEDRNGFSDRGDHWFRQKLEKYLIDLVKAKYYRYLWHKQWLQLKLLGENTKSLFDDFRDNKRERFIQEAQGVSMSED